MSHDLRRISFFAVVFLVLLRLSIGWQFLYEGLWKYQTQSTGKPWTAEGYLLNAQGPFRSTFRNMTGDPDGLNWLDKKNVEVRWENWAKNFTAHYQLDDQQKTRLDEILNGPKAYEVPLSHLPDAVKFNGSLGPRIEFRPGKTPDAPGTLFIKKGQTLQPAHRDRLLDDFVTEKAEPEYHAAVVRLYEMISTPAYKKRLQVILSDPDYTGAPLKDKEGNVVEERINKADVYKARLDQYENQLAAADKEYDYEHLKKDWEEIQGMRKSLVGPIETLDADLKTDARKILTDEQRNMGPLPAEDTPIHKIDQLTMWSLMILGGLLIAGFFTRLSALLAAGMVLSFYLVNPPWPGLPPQIGPEHSYIVNKNFIEVVALVGAHVPAHRKLVRRGRHFPQHVPRQKIPNQNRSLEARGEKTRQTRRRFDLKHRRAEPCKRPGGSRNHASHPAAYAARLA